MKETYNKLLKTLIGIKPGLMAASIFLNVIIFGYGAVTAGCIRGILNALSGSQAGSGIRKEIWFYLLCMALAAGVRWAGIRTSAYVDVLRHYHYTKWMRLAMFRGIFASGNLKDMAGRKGYLLERLDDDIPAVTFPTELVTEVTGYLIYTMIAIGTLLFTNWRITVFVFIPLSVGIFVVHKAAEKLQENRNASRNKHDEISVILGDLISSALLLRAMGARKNALNYYDAENEERRKAIVKYSLFGKLVYFGVEMASVASIAMIMLAVAALMRKGNFPVGDFAIFIVYLDTLSDCIMRIVELVMENKKAEVSWQRIAEWVEPEMTLPTGGRTVLPTKGGKESWEGSREVVWRQRGEEENVFKPFQALQVEGLTCVYADGRGVRDVNFEVRAGEVLLIRGKTASGKSSIIYAMTGIMNRDSGSVRWNGREVDEPGEVFKAPLVGVALQDGNLLNVSIRENLTMGNKYDKKQLEELWEALKAGAIYEEVRSMPKGLDTMVGEGGVMLSGGQKQRILFARMLLQHPTLYLIDNATNALDAETEERLYDGLKKRIKEDGAAAVIINDREAAVKIADEILVLEG